MPQTRAIAVFAAILVMTLGVLYLPFRDKQVSLALYLLVCVGAAIVFFVLLISLAALTKAGESGGKPAADPKKGLRTFALVLGLLFAIVYAAAVSQLGWSASISTLAIYAAGYATILTIAFVFRRRQ